MVLTACAQTARIQSLSVQSGWSGVDITIDMTTTTRIRSNLKVCVGQFTHFATEYTENKFCDSLAGQTLPAAVGTIGNGVSLSLLVIPPAAE